MLYCVAHTSLSYRCKSVHNHPALLQTCNTVLVYNYISFQKEVYGTPYQPSFLCLFSDNSVAVVHSLFWSCMYGLHTHLLGVAVMRKMMKRCCSYCLLSLFEEPGANEQHHQVWISSALQMIEVSYK
jgi:hypothetical protein